MGVWAARREMSASRYIRFGISYPVAGQKLFLWASWARGLQCLVRNVGNSGITPIRPVFITHGRTSTAGRDGIVEPRVKTFEGRIVHTSLSYMYYRLWALYTTTEWVFTVQRHVNLRINIHIDTHAHTNSYRAFLINLTNTITVVVLSTVFTYNFYFYFLFILAQEFLRPVGTLYFILYISTVIFIT